VDHRHRLQMLSVSGTPMSLGERIKVMGLAVDAEAMALHVVVDYPAAVVEHSHLEEPMHLQDHHSAHRRLHVTIRTNPSTPIHSLVLFLEPPLFEALDESCGNRTSWITICINNDAHKYHISTTMFTFMNIPFETCKDTATD
jgi:hypothetical protein